MWVIIWMTIGWFTALLVHALENHENMETKPQTIYGVLGGLISGWFLTFFGTGQTLIGLSLFNLILIFSGAFAVVAIKTGYIRQFKVLFDKLKPIRAKTLTLVRR